MTIAVTVPADTKTPGTAGHTTDHNAISDALTTLGANAANTGGDTFTGAVSFAASASDTKSGGRIYGAQADASQSALTNPVAFADISHAYTIPANDAAAGTTYIIELQFFGVWQASGNLNIGFDLDGTKANLVPVASGLATAGQNYGGTVRLYLQVITTGTGGTYNVWTDGGATQTASPRGGTTGAVLNGHSNGSLNTTVSHTLAVCADFSVSNASQTITGYGSTFTRKGP